MQFQRGDDLYQDVLPDLVQLIQGTFVELAPDNVARADVDQLHRHGDAATGAMNRPGQTVINPKCASDLIEVACPSPEPERGCARNDREGTQPAQPDDHI